MNRNLMIIRILALVALALTGYIFWTTISESAQLAGCGEGSGCDAVLQTRWSSWFGLPVSTAAFFVYGAIFVLTFFVSNDRSPGWIALLFFALIASLSGLWFMILQTFLIKSYCVYCSMVHLCGILITVLAFRTIPVQKDEPAKKKKAVRTGIPARKYFYAGMFAVGAVIVLVIGQLKTGSAVVDQVPQASTGDAAVSIPTRTVRLMNGALPVNVGEFPVLGLLEAERVIGHVFDYTCPACRKLHSNLVGAQQSNRQSSIVMIPMPLDAECNPGVQQTSYLHLNACTFAKIGLAIWRTKPDAYAAYDQFMFSTEHPPTAEEARSVANRLVGSDAMDGALKSPEVNGTLRSGISLFYSQALQRKVLPILMTPEKAVYGIPNQKELTSLFAHQ
jgi:uncharacterized membrane protein